MENKHLVWEIGKISREHRKFIEREITELGIHPSQHHLLMYLARNGPSTQSAIAQAMEVSAATIAVSLKKLEKGKYIEKRVNPEDNRFNQIVLTKQGGNVVAISKSLFDAADETMFHDFTEEEKNQFHGFLERVIQNIRAMEEK